MSVDGVWDAVLKSPMGAQSYTVTLQTDGDVVTGEAEGESGAPMPVQGGKFDGETLSFAIDVTSPMKLKINVEMTLSGDELTGHAKAGIFGKFPMTATRR